MDVTADGGSWAFLTLPDGEMILDPGATQDLIGFEAFSSLSLALAAVGLQPIRVEKVASVPSGIGSVAKPKFVALIPISPGGTPGILEMTVLEERIPPLLSVGFLDFLGAVISLPDNKVFMKKLDVELPMRRLPTGHRTINVVQWTGGTFPVPLEVQRKFGITEGAFNKDASASCAYTKAVFRIEGVETNQGIEHEPNFKTPTSESSETLHVSHASQKPHSDAAVVHLDAQGEGVGKVDFEIVMNHGMHSAHQPCHDADSQCLQIDNSKDRMGINTSCSQFDSSLTRNGTRLSTEPRVQLVSPRQPAAATMGKVDAGNDDCLGGQPPQLCASGQGRAQHQEQPQPASAPPRGTLGECVSPPSGASGESLKPVCQLEGMQQVRCPCPVPVQEVPCQGQGQGQDIAPGNSALRGHAINARGNSNDSYQEVDSIGSITGCGFGKLRGDPTSAADLPTAGKSDEYGHDPSGIITPGACPRTVPDDHAAARSNFFEPGATAHGGGPVVISDRRDAEPQQSEQRRPMSTWPRWMSVASACATSMLLSWDQMSHEFQEKLQGVCNPSEATYAFQYDLGGSQEVDFGLFGHLEEDVEWISERPLWVPSFASASPSSFVSCSQLRCDPVPGQCCLWRRVINARTQEILEDSPKPAHVLDFATPLDLWVIHWTLPLDFMRLAALNTTETSLTRLDSEGCLSEQGRFWVGHSDHLAGLSDISESSWISDVGSSTDLQRCAANLCRLSRQEQQHSPQHLDFAELFSPPRVVPYAQKLGLRTQDQVFDLQAGWDVRKKSHRQSFRQFQKKKRPRMLMASPVCKAFSPLQNINQGRIWMLRSLPKTYMKAL